MKTILAAVIFWGLALPGAASTIDAYSANSEVLRSGDTLTLLFSTTSFTSHANSLGISPDPTEITFSFSTMPAGLTGEFQASVQSLDGSASAAWPGALSWSAGAMQSYTYAGSVSTVYGTLTLSDAESKAIFGQPESELVLQYFGPDLSIGIAGYTLQEDFRIGLSGGGLSVGVMNEGLIIADEGLRDGLTPLALQSQRVEAPTPEPASGAFVLAASVAGILEFCRGKLAGLKQFTSPRIQ